MTAPSFPIRGALRRFARTGVLVCAAAISTVGSAQVNLDFEMPARDATDAQGARVSGWRITDDAAIDLDSSTSRSGSTSLRVVARQARVRSRFSQAIDVRDQPSGRLRISAYVKTAAGTAGAPVLRAWVEGENGLIYVDRTDRPYAPGPDGWMRLELDAPVASTARSLSFGGELVGHGEAWFDDFTIERVDVDRLPPPSPAVSRYVAYALSVIDEHALVRSELDWADYRAAVMQQTRGAVSTADSYLALRFALGILGDGHSHFRSAAQAAALTDRPVENARTRRPLIAPEAEVIAESIAYLRLPGFAGGTHMDRVEFAERLQALVAAHDAAASCGWIVDLRDNSGGNVWPMIAGLGPLLGEGDVATSVWPDGSRRRIWYRDGKAGLDDYVQLRVRGRPYVPRDDVRPIAVVLDERTASAAELIAIAFAARSGSRSFGRPTGGATTATQTFPLSDGAELVLAVASTSDRHGRLYRGAIEPDEPVSTTERGLPLVEQPAVRAAADWLEAVCTVGSTG